MNNLTKLMIATAISGSIPSTLTAQDNLRSSVVKIESTHRFPDLFRPWTKSQPRKSQGSGVIIDGNLILTNAHVVRYARQIYVQGYQSDDRIAATVTAISSGMDLAVLEVQDDKFFTQRPALSLTENLPSIKDPVNAYGYPVGGNELSVTEGIISRIEMAPYYQETVGLRIQVDAALNPGNSGGPAIVDGKIVGIVYSGVPSADNIGYLIPADEVRMFLDDIKDGRYDGKPHMFDGVQKTENTAMRRRLGLPDDVSGLMVQSPYRSHEDYPLKQWDVITKIASHPLDREGNVQIRDDLRLSFLYLVPKLARDGKVNLTVLRDGKTVEVDLPVKVRRDLVLPYLHNDYPRYFIYGPLVFSQATQEIVTPHQALNALLRARGSPLLTRNQQETAFEGEQIVVVPSRFFPHRITKGYDDPVLQVVKEINGVPTRNLAHLVETLRDADGEFVEFRFAGNHQVTLVFRHAEIASSTEEILEDNGIRFQYSKDLVDIWHRNDD